MEISEITEKAGVLAGVFQYFATEGVTLIQQEKPLTFEEWKVLYGKAHVALMATSFSETAKRIFEAVMMRGIRDAAHLLPEENASDEQIEEFIREYRSGSDLDKWSDRYLGHMIGFERIPDIHERAKVVNLLVEEIAVPLMKRTKGKLGRSLIDAAAIARFPGEHDARVPFKSYWESKGNS